MRQTNAESEAFPEAEVAVSLLEDARNVEGLYRGTIQLLVIAVIRPLSLRVRESAGRGMNQLKRLP